MTIAADSRPIRRENVGLMVFAEGLLLAAIAWGAFAFGAVYRWAFWPLAVAALIVALIGIVAPGDSRPLGLTRLAASFAAFITLAALQLIPLPLDRIRAISPQAIGVIAQLDQEVAVGLTRQHPLSIAAGQTATAIAMFAAFALLILGGARLLSLRGARGLAERIAIIGTVLALLGILHKPVFGSQIYGFWTIMGGLPYDPYGPFINKNHFAGWMLMALPLTLGLFASGLARGMRHIKPGFRQRILWLSSPEANQLLLLAAAAALMALSLILTMSRSGIAAGGMAATATLVLLVRRQATRAKKLAGLVIVSAIAVLVVTWVGPGKISERFSEANWRQINNRKGAWIDGVEIARRYWAVGTGLNTYGVATLFYQRHGLSEHYAQAHNDYLQLAAEGGALLLIPAILSSALFASVVRRRFKEGLSSTAYWIRAGAVIGLSAIALQECVDFSLQMPGNAFLFAVLCAVALHREPERTHTRVALEPTLLNAAPQSGTTPARSCSDPSRHSSANRDGYPHSSVNAD